MWSTGSGFGNGFGRYSRWFFAQELPLNYRVREGLCEWRRSGGSRWIERGLAHVREEKEGNDVCGRTRSPDREEFGTRQRRKERKRRVRRDEVVDERGGSYLPRKKKARSSQEKQEKGRNI